MTDNMKSNVTVATILALVAIAFIMNVQESVVAMKCGREGYPTVRRTGLVAVTCFKVENGSTIQK